MLFKTYGKTGKRVSAVSFGGMRFPNPEDIDAGAEVVLHAHRKGVNYFDTAPGYCNDKSEEIVGAALRQMDRDAFYVSTKCMASSGSDLRRSLEKSLKRLGVETIDFFHIWCLVQPDEWPRRKAGGAVAEALKAKDQGLVNHVVFSTHLMGGQNVPIIEEGVFEGMLLGYSAVNFPFRQAAVDAAARAGIGIVAMNPLGGGVIPANAERFDFIRSPNDPDVVTAAIRFIVGQPAVTTALVGCGTKAHVDHAVAAVEGFQPYSAEHVAQMKSRVEQGFDGLCTGCGYCLPCQAALEIPKLMDAYNHKVLQGSDQAVKDRLKWHWGLAPDAAATCIECGACETACTQHLPIVERLRHIAQLKD